jgi:hypothetical protein
MAVEMIRTEVKDKYSSRVVVVAVAAAVWEESTPLPT